MDRREIRRWTFLAIVWGAGLASVAAMANRYETTPGADRPTLLVFLHPRCSCSRATVATLQDLDLAGTQVASLEPLAGLRLASFASPKLELERLRPVLRASLKRLEATESRGDLAALAGAGIEELWLAPGVATPQALDALPMLRVLNGRRYSP